MTAPHATAATAPTAEPGVHPTLAADLRGSVRRVVQRDGLVFLEHEFEVPLRHSIAAPEAADIEGERITVFVREVAQPTAYRDGSYRTRPALLFLQGGPGGASPRPLGPEGWVGAALRHGFRVLLLDQRGTGRSTPVTVRQLNARGDVSAQVEYLSWHRADNIVADCEWIRSALLGEETWSTLGQSYGGFCTLTYLSFAPHGLKECLITGGLATLDEGADSVYERTFELMRRRNLEFYRQYPHLTEVVATALRLCATGDVRLPCGERLTPERLTSLGMLLGSGSGLHELAWLFEAPFEHDAQGAPVALTTRFLHGVQQHVGFATAPLYAVLHESIYQHTDAGQAASQWSAFRVRGRTPGFEAPGAATSERPQFFVGESIEPWLFEQDSTLQPYREVAEAIAAKDDWGPLYDLERLRSNSVPVAAAVYHDDMYVPLETSLRTAATISAQTFITNQLQHDGLRASATLFDTVLELARR
ncbi:alpha/beta fold hydrolase [Micrococcales bacterium 31B]|nr:alpha/beta fold hydrolase [Micrococcales bacterium 31B]